MIFLCFLLSPSKILFTFAPNNQYVAGKDNINAAKEIKAALLFIIGIRLTNDNNKEK